MDHCNMLKNLSQYILPAKMEIPKNGKIYIKLQIVNSIGEIVYIEYLDSFMGGFVKTIDLSKYSKGVYILQIKSNKGNLSKKNNFTIKNYEPQKYNRYSK